ncbi:MAG: sodium-dependent transporter, partial [Cyclobacteriaceae bacterium]
MESNKPQYTSGLATILTMVGVAVGLGNVWRFPYMMGSYGGSAFLAIYLLFTILFAYPALMAEMALGRMSGKGT